MTENCRLFEWEDGEKGGKSDSKGVLVDYVRRISKKIVKRLFIRWNNFKYILQNDNK